MTDINKLIEIALSNQSSEKQKRKATEQLLAEAFLNLQMIAHAMRIAHMSESKAKPTAKKSAKKASVEKPAKSPKNSPRKGGAKSLYLKG